MCGSWLLTRNARILVSFSFAFSDKRFELLKSQCIKEISLSLTAIRCSAKRYSVSVSYRSFTRSVIFFAFSLSSLQSLFVSPTQTSLLPNLLSVCFPLTLFILSSFPLPPCVSPFIPPFSLFFSFFFPPRFHLKIQINDS